MRGGGGGGERKKVRVDLWDRQIVELWASEGGLRGVIEGFFVMVKGRYLGRAGRGGC